ncbi:hypothetical protein QN219_18645 [Sinorhizobium sp. 7-81]|uniref:hypothetical protein n=1 Tax=Sinorhizobium sp. 8-89 TaxID=3049089 RepID=UPI0024C438E6|nr:hypothetical protein [Sinorhizobium sp. 8-89]MDK1492061.1 hypothetical protein [Sinorhizobium sp. 8-89]
MTEGDNTQQVLQCMTTEHFVLQTARTATIQEANQRANLFLTSVSSATIALAFVAQVTQMGPPFVLFSLILLPCLFFIGLVTFVRAVQVAIEDMVHARGMARIRHYYTEFAPVMQKYLIHSTHDDRSAVLVDKGFKPSPQQYFMSVSGMVSTINGAIAGVFAGIVATSLFSSGMVLGVISGICAFATSSLLLRRYHMRAWAAAEHKLPTLFPGSPES